jgi:hypothetical protein
VERCAGDDVLPDVLGQLFFLRELVRSGPEIEYRIHAVNRGAYLLRISDLGGWQIDVVRSPLVRLSVRSCS